MSVRDGVFRWYVAGGGVPFCGLSAVVVVRY